MLGEEPTVTPVPPKEDPESFVLRGRPRSPVRFRKSVIVGGTGLVAVTLAGLAWFALEPPTFRVMASGDKARIEQDRTPEALAGAPAAYSDVPKLGPPLPGDLGRPILEQQRELAPNSNSPPGPSSLYDDRAAAEQRFAAEAQAARGSPLLVQIRRSAPEPVPPPPPADAAQAAEAKGSDREPKAALVRAEGVGTVPTPATLKLSAGTIIAASLITGINSDLPGIVLAQVSENVRDSATGRTVLIPQGARLLGRYDSSISFGQKRALLVWERIVFPDGTAIKLDKTPATDATGQSGLEDRVNFHEGRLLKGVALATLLGVGSELSFGGGGDLVRAVRESAQQNGARAGDQIVAKNLDVQPSLSIRPGWPVRAILQDDLALQPWRG